MAKILADRDINKLLGTVILNADPERINPNGIEIRLGTPNLHLKRIDPDYFQENE
jgi:deoxycytidine triphosphate deaminase